MMSWLGNGRVIVAMAEVGAGGGEDVPKDNLRDYRTSSATAARISASVREQSEENRKLSGSVLSREQLVSHLAAFDLRRRINLATFLMKGCPGVRRGPFLTGRPRIRCLISIAVTCDPTVSTGWRLVPFKNNLGLPTSEYDDTNYKCFVTQFIQF
ncbi:hypothetical protein GWI33_004909 [Rhynchophorus ferrugineus]|uniref:Uncharacterized protein n=1 Tax=Rhynchophorus ferrugineus TaxID=354439 RepID=A0A834IPA4_RHYFE|nr:hypothetical protein GWI33_004909 [Rhynchophorus ferrugineus]